MDKLELIRQRCIEANPIDITKPLGLSSRVVLSRTAIRHGLRPWRKVGTIVGESRDRRCWWVQQDRQSSRSAYAKEFLTASPDLGRAIRLADVLWAYEQVEGVNHSDFKQGRIAILNHWNLRSDDLSQQSEETIDFLADLLTN